MSTEESNVVKVNAKEHPIKGVTVYQSNRAVVERSFPVELKAGQNEIQVGHLPTVVDGDSLRVEASTTSRTQHLTVFDVVHKPPTYPASTIVSVPNSDRDALIEERTGLETRIAGAEGQKSILEGYSDELRRGKVEIPTEKLDGFLDAFATRQWKIYKDKARWQKEIEPLTKRIDEIDKEALAELEKKRATGVNVVLLAEEAGEAVVNLSYVVRQASWSSLYDVRADLASTSGSGKETPSIQIQYRANITQTTGESWDKVALTLSTASSLIGSAVPKLEPWRIGQKRVDRMAHWRNYGGIGGGGPPIPPPPPGALPPNPVLTRMKSASHSVESSRSEVISFDAGPQVQVTSGAISSTFAIDGLSTIPSDGASHKVSISTIDLSAELEWITVPRSLPSAFLQCRIKNTSQYQFIQGPSNVFMDGTFVSKSQVPDVSPQETFSCSLGVDPSVRVTYHPQQKIVSTSGGGLMSNKTRVTSIRQRISIKNTRRTSIARLVIQDRVPLSEDSQIQVNVHQPSEKTIGPATAPTMSLKSSSLKSSSALGSTETLVEKVGKNVIARWAQKEEEGGGSGGPRYDGVVEWIASGLADSLDVELAYDVTTPQGIDWA